MLQLTKLEQEVSFIQEVHPALHPGRCARIDHKDQAIGYLGELHPAIKKQLGVKSTIYLFELNLSCLMKILLTKFIPLSRFPMMQRDIAIVINESISAQRLVEEILAIGNKLLRNVQIFDIYQGEGVEEGKKSVALNLIFQHSSRTLVDEEVDGFIKQIVAKLKHQFSAILRG